MHNKRAQLGKQVMIFPFLFLIVIIGVGIALGIGIYFGSGYDMRQTDSNILLYKIERCFVSNNLNDIQASFYTTCGLDESSIESNHLMVKICENLDVVSCVQDNAKAFIVSGSNFQACLFEGGKQNNAFPKCSNSTLIKDGRSFSVITGSNQQIKRVNDNG